MNIVQKLLLGQAEIDRMRKETNWVVQTLISLIDTSPQIIGRKMFRGEGEITWDVTDIRGKPRPSDPQFWVRCYKGPEHMSLLVYSNYPYNPDQDPPLMGLHGVLMAHAALETFVDGMLKEFPELYAALEPHYRAAAAAA